MTIKNIDGFDLEQYLWNKAKEYGFGKEKAEYWVKYMLDSSRGDEKLGANIVNRRRNTKCGWGSRS